MNIFFIFIFYFLIKKLIYLLLYYYLFNKKIFFLLFQYNKNAYKNKQIIICVDITIPLFINNYLT